MQEAISSNTLQGISLGPNCPPIHSLLFADDLLICGHATAAEGDAISNIINNFCQASGQTPNMTKSAILFSHHVDDTTKQGIRAILPVLTSLLTPPT
jgi:hypothetical protein